MNKEGQKKEKKGDFEESCKEVYYADTRRPPGLPEEIERLYYPYFTIHRHPQYGYWELKAGEKKTILKSNFIPVLYRIHVCSRSTASISVGVMKVEVKPGQTLDYQDVDIYLEVVGERGEAHGTYELLCCPGNPVQDSTDTR